MTSREINLNARAIASLEKSNWDRRVELQRPQAIFRMNDFQQISERLEVILAAGPHLGSKGMMLTGYVGSGKSTILQYFARENSDIQTGNGISEKPVVYVTIEGSPTKASLYEQILDAMQIPKAGRSKDIKPPQLAHRFLRSMNVQMLILDEIQHINLSRSGKATAVLYDTIKHIGNSTGIPVVCAGTRSICKTILEEDKAIHRRVGTPEEPDLYLEVEDLIELLSVIEPTIGLKKACSLTTPKMVESVLKHSNGTIDSIYTALRRAAQFVIQTGEERITSSTLDTMGWEVVPLSDGSRS